MKRNHSIHHLPSISCCNPLIPAVLTLPLGSSSLYTHWGSLSGRYYQNGSNNHPSRSLKDSVKQSPSQPRSIWWMLVFKHGEWTTSKLLSQSSTLDSHHTPHAAERGSPIHPNLPPTAAWSSNSFSSSPISQALLSNRPKMGNHLKHVNTHRVHGAPAGLANSLVGPFLIIC